MSQTIDQAYVQGYAKNLYMLAEQRGTKLRSCVDAETGLVGKKHARERLSGTHVVEITTRHGDTTREEITHSRRWLTCKSYKTSELIDDLEDTRLLIDPQNPYVLRQGSALGRKTDEIVIDAAFGNAEYGEDGGSNQAFDTTNNRLAVTAGATGNTNLTIEKLRAAAMILEQFDHDPAENPWYLVATASQKRSLLATTEVTSADYATVKALVQGQVNSFMGFMFKWVNGKRYDGTKILPVDASDYRRVLAFIGGPNGALKLGVGRDVKVDIGPRRDKNLAIQIYSRMNMGSVRMEESACVEILCDETVYGATTT